LIIEESSKLRQHEALQGVGGVRLETLDDAHRKFSQLDKVGVK
jgi:hypothetical protein